MNNEHISKPKAYFLVAILGMSTVVAALGMSNLATTWGKQVAGNREGSTEDANVNHTPFPNVALSAKAAVVYDATTGQVLFQKNAEAQVPLASLTKIMLAVTARDLLPKDATIAIDAKFLKETGDTGLREGQEWTLKNILDKTLVESSNDGAAAIAGAYAAFEKNTSTSSVESVESRFLGAMNAKAHSLGLSQTYFLNVTGLDVNSTISGGYGSAKDVAKLLSYAVKTYPDVFEATSYEEITVSSIGKTKYKVENTDTIISEIPGLIASKTGYTDLAGGNLAVLFDVGPMRPIAIVVLGSTEDGRFSDTLALVNTTLSFITKSE